MSGLSRLLAPLRRRVQLLVTRALVNAVNSDGGIQLLQISTGKNETLHDVGHHEPYGYTSHPHQGAEAIALALGGSRSHTLAILVGDRRYRLAGLAEGEVAVYDDLEQQIILKRDGIEINAPQGYIINGDGVLNGTLAVTGEATFEADVQMDSALHVDGEATSDTDFVSAGKSGASHVHGGVTSGGNSTAPPT